MVSNFTKIVKQHLGHLPSNDYPVLNSQLFVSCWLGFTLDKSLGSMRDLFERLNLQGISLDISTFSKASKSRSPEIFEKLLWQIVGKLKKKKKPKELELFPLDSTIISLTSKLLWNQGYHQVKLFSGINLINNELGGVFIHFGYGNDNKYGEETIEATPENGVGIMDRGFCKLNRIKELSAKKEQYFLMRIKNNMTLEMKEDGYFLVGKGDKQIKVRVVNFCDPDNPKKTEFRLVTNIPEELLSNEEIAAMYVKRWQIELLWKFLKMHLKLAKLITKNVNGITIQIYSVLIAYVLLQLVEIPSYLGSKLLNKLRYLQSFMCKEISYIHWFKKILVAQ